MEVKRQKLVVKQVKGITYIELLKKDSILHFLHYLSVLALSYYYAFYIQNTMLTLLVFIYALTLTLPHFLHDDSIYYDDALVENVKEEKFFVGLGFHVERLFNNIKSSAKDKNKLKPLLLNESKYSTHLAILGTTGSGKTVTMQYLVGSENGSVMSAGGGFIYIDGKGSEAMSRTWYGLAISYGRESDFHLINFADQNNSESFSFFEMTKEQVNEIFKLMLESNDGNEWKDKAISLMTSVIYLLIDLKALGLVFKLDECVYINNFNDVLTIKNKHVLNFTIISDFLTNTDSLFKLLQVMCRLYDDEHFVDYADSIINKDILVREEKRDVHSLLKSFLMSETNLTLDEILHTSIFKLKENSGSQEFDYTIGVAIGTWSKVLLMFKSEYGKICNSSTPSINIKDIIKQHKLLYVVLPGTKSSETRDMLARMMLSQITASYEDLKVATPLEVPYTVILDEFNSYGAGMCGIANLFSQSREQKLCFIVGAQSSLAKIDDGKNLEGGQILANINTIITLKLTDNELIKTLNERYPRREYLEDVSKYRARVASEGESGGSVESSYQAVDKEYFFSNELSALDSGEAHVLVGSKAYKTVMNYYEVAMYEPLDYDKKIQFIKRMDKKTVLREWGMLKESMINM
jgi:hypothetical protein